jgi:hypothetical protein
MSLHLLRLFRRLGEHLPLAAQPQAPAGAMGGFGGTPPSQAAARQPGRTAGSPGSFRSFRIRKETGRTPQKTPKSRDIFFLVRTVCARFAHGLRTVQKTLVSVISICYSDSVRTVCARDPCALCACAHGHGFVRTPAQKRNRAQPQKLQMCSSFEYH